MKKEVYIYKAFERFWHWAQAFLIFFLGMTGFEIHGSFSFFGYQNAVHYHNYAAISLIVLIIFTIFWHLATGEWRNYLPTKENIIAQMNYYIFGIFKNAPHPHRKTELSKLNPLQKLTYFGLKVILLPLMLISGLIYMFYRYPSQGDVMGLKISSIAFIAILHTAGAFLLVTFIIAHLYLITTGEKVTTNLRAMITGYEELSDGKADDIETEKEEPLPDISQEIDKGWN